EYSLTAADAVVQKTPFSFDVSVWEFFWPLLAGARLVVAQPGGHQDSGYLVKLLAEQRVTTVHFVPSMLRAFLEEPGLAALTHLKRVVCSGEALPVDLVKRAHAHLPSTSEVHNLYGPTEAAVDVSSWHCVRGDTRPSIPIGRPVANTRLYVLDAHGQPSPIGIPGELFIAGVQVGLGYWNRPQLTAERFLPDTFGPVAHGRMYRTGDLARWASDGTLEYLGRSDFQVKLRGFRIELGDVEAALLTHPDVREAVVALREGPGGARLVGYVTGAEGLVLAGLKPHLLQRLPEYMVPSAFVHLPALPLTPSGKVDRNALPMPEAPSAQGALSVPPRSPLEARLASLFAQALGLDTVGVHDDFFALGGHSLLATQVVARVRAWLGFELSLRAFFESPTVARLADRLSTATRSVPTQRAIAPALRVAGEDGVCELAMSFSQQSLWFLDQLQPGLAAYNMPAVLRLRGPLRVEPLRRAFTELVRRHETLRTTFGGRDGRLIQRIHPSPSDWSLPVAELQVLEHSDQGVALQRRIDEEIHKPFDLERGPLLRTTLLKTGEAEHLLILCMHHIVSDGWSMGVLVRELAELHEAFSTNRAPVLAELPVQYADYSVWQRAGLGDTIATERLEEWRAHLQGSPALELRGDHVRPASRSFRGNTLEFSIPAGLVDALTKLGEAHGATLFMVLMTGWQALLSRYSGQRDFVLGASVGHRAHPEVEGLIGFFVNPVPLRFQWEGDPSVQKMLERVRDEALTAFSRQEQVPFDRLVEALGGARDLSRSPLFQSLFVLDAGPFDVPPLAGLQVERVPVVTQTARFDLMLSLRKHEDGMAAQLEYSLDLFMPETARRLGEHLLVVLEALAEGPRERRLSQLPLMTEDERRQVLEDFQGWREPYPEDVLLHTLIEAQVDRTPHAEAVRFESEALTYAQLDARANQLAHHLRALGVGPHQLVAVCLERSLDMVVALVAVLKSGAAYVP
ncbi:condensation domain-containing protein, partial [Myxococcus sp. K15C18031901]|uniref:condensation domain-containing protein n=1 Tax=Myxococcus dinghuensis TaxID=2906761 RepID=UPI0020A779E1